ncbi:MAG TPA: type II secretion system protein GspM [Conexibacter sp.]|nr:type II secretion system protein GspM [Conexibacter sp.]
MTARDRTLIAVVGAVLVVLAAWFLVLAPQRDQASQLSDQIAAQRQQLAQAASDLAAGLAAKRTYGRDYTTVARLGAAVPDDDNVPSLLLQVQRAAQATQIDFRDLQVAPGGGGAAPPPPPPTPGAGGASASQTTTATLPPGASVGTAGFPTMPFRFTFTGDFFNMSDFIGRLERFLVVRNRSLAVSGRFMTIDGIALSAAPGGFPKVEASVAATTYLLPPTQGLTDGASPSGPAAATPASAGATSSSSAPSNIPAATATPVVHP